MFKISINTNRICIFVILTDLDTKKEYVKVVFSKSMINLAIDNLIREYFL